VRVLQQIGAGFMDQAIGELIWFVHGGIPRSSGWFFLELYENRIKKRSSAPLCVWQESMSVAEFVRIRVD
jgi:hypothetical protein